VLPRAIAGFAARHEALELQFEGQNAQRVMENVLAGHVDVGITQVLGPAPGIGLIAAFRTDCVCVMPKGHALAGEAVVGPKALAAHPLVALPGHSPAGLSLARILAEAGIEVVPRVKTFLSSAACALVAEGVGIAVVDAFTAEFFAGRLEVRPFLPAVDFGFQAIRPALQAPSRAAQAFSAHLLDALAVDPRIRPG
jgi:DNA-binding transcriptional LysR family regulator